MKNTRLMVATIGLAFAAGCGENGITDPNPPTITLSAQQAATIVAAAEDLADVHADLAWLADSIELVIRAGAQAKRLDVGVNGEDVFFYGVSLQRDVQTASSSFATWHLLAFDDASNPTQFIVANGYASSSTTTAPTSVNGGFGGQSVFAHWLTVSGSNVTDRRALTGGATFATRSIGAACPIVGTPPAGVTCNIAEMDVSFDIVQLTPASNQTLNLLATTVPGVLLQIEPSASP